MKARTLWRLTGLLCLAGAFVLVLFSDPLLRGDADYRFIMIFWGSLLCLLGAVVYIAFLDIHFTRLVYKKQERALFRQTFLGERHKEEAHEKADESGSSVPPEEA
ncbi:MAG TPA: hypothetical protein PKN92_02875 [Candidatus Hydrogenedentes bacterium]|nr:hypothetical protein [Candidatus Hydrogenedentota bacterium]